MNNEKMNKVAVGLKGLGGCFLIAKIEGVDFVQSGSVDGNSYGSSIKLKFAKKEEIIKIVNGSSVSTVAYKTQIIKLAVSDSELISKVQEYNLLIGREVLISIELADNAVFKTTNIQEVA